MDIAEKTDTDIPISGIIASDIMHLIPKILPLLEKVVKPVTGHTVHDVIISLMLDQKQLWIVGDFCAITVTTIQHRPAEKVLWIDWMSGHDMPHWVNSWANFQDKIAGSMGCTSIEFAGRIGNKRFEKLYGNCKPISTIYRRELTQ